MPVDCLIKPGGTPPAALKSPFATLIPISLLLLSTERGRGYWGTLQITLKSIIRGELNEFREYFQSIRYINVG